VLTTGGIRGKKAKPLANPRSFTGFIAKALLLQMV
jgi:hypothetical protein